MLDFALILGKGSSDDLSLRVYLQQRFDKGLSPTPVGIKAFVEILGQSSLTGEVSYQQSESDWDFSSTALENDYRSYKKYCVGYIDPGAVLILALGLMQSRYPKYMDPPLVRLGVHCRLTFISR